MKPPSLLSAHQTVLTPSSPTGAQRTVPRTGRPGTCAFTPRPADGVHKCRAIRSMFIYDLWGIPHVFLLLNPKTFFKNVSLLLKVSLMFLFYPLTPSSPFPSPPQAFSTLLPVSMGHAYVHISSLVDLSLPPHPHLFPLRFIRLLPASMFLDLFCLSVYFVH